MNNLNKICVKKSNMLMKELFQIKKLDSKLNIKESKRFLKSLQKGTYQNFKAKLPKILKDWSEGMTMRIIKDDNFDQFGLKVWYINEDVYVETKDGFDLHEFNQYNDTWKVTSFDKDLNVIYKKFVR